MARAQVTVPALVSERVRESEPIQALARGKVRVPAVRV